MIVDPRLDAIDDCLYRVAIRALVIHENKVLLVKEIGDSWWSPPGGGVNHGESVKETLAREVEEELGIPSKYVASDFKIAYYNIGNVVNGVPRMNIFFKASVPVEMLKKTSHVKQWAWFSKEQFLHSDLNSSFDKAELTNAIFAN